MRRKSLVLVALVALVVGLSVFTPSVSYADVIINSISVNIGGTIFNGCVGACPGAPPPPAGTQVWDLTGANSLAAGETLVLTQNGPGLRQFDTSEFTTGTAAITVNRVGGIDGFNDATRVLTVSGLDPSGGTTTSFNEATQYRSLGIIAGAYELLVGYADNLHTNACGSGIPGPPPATNNTPSLTCKPNNAPFDALNGGTPTHFIGAAFAAPGYPQSTNANHCHDTDPVASCFDAGVILIRAIPRVVTPEPSSLMLLGAGLVALAVYGRKHLKKKDA